LSLGATQIAGERPALAAIAPYAATIFLSSFLLFLVQPLIAKQVLPWFGGTAAVWTTCLVFFQSVLLAGYAYADWTMRLGARRQVLLHVALLAVSLAFLPILASSGWKPRGDEQPIVRILLLLTATIGLPYFLLSTTTPLLQAWYARRFHSAVPYRLFALSNLASLLALLGFPVLFEPNFDLKELGWGWSALYAAFALLCAAAATRSVNGDAVPLPQAAAHAPAPPPRALQLRWVGLAALGSAMLLAVTNHVTQNVASVPFLWVLPLALYLITFILAFDRPRWYARRVFVPAFLGVVPAMAYWIPSLNLSVATPLFLAGLFVVCMVCHGELARMRPDPRHLTRYYLAIALGGALGAALVAIAAPLLLPGYFELGIALVAAALLVPLGARGPLAWAGVAVVLVTAFFAGRGAIEYTEDVRVMRRDFYGVVRTKDYSYPEPYRTMLHGGIQHGGQLLAEEHRRTPSDYFGDNSGYGRVFRALREEYPNRTLKVGVIGLGAGVLAAWMRPGDLLTFYEISPTVAEIAKSEFTYLVDTAARTRVVLGDGRLSLEREPPAGYDVLGIDAFSSDSIPMHLITREAMATYVRSIAPDGVIVFQATNRFVSLPPLIKRLAAEFGMQAVNVVDEARPADDGPEAWLSSTEQVIVTKNRRLLAAAPIAEGGAPIADRPELPLFTDSHSNLLRILK
jgi:hypothetical protein